MAYDESTADQIRLVLSERTDVVQKPMIGGGVAFMVGGRMCCGLRADGLTVRVGPQAKVDALAMTHVRPLRMGDREAAAFVVVEPEGYRTDKMLQTWIQQGLRFVGTLPQI